MKERSKNGLLVLFGIAAGAAAGFYLNSDKGRKVRKTAGDQLNRWGDDLSERTRNGMDQLSSSVNSAVDRGKEYIGEVGGTLRSRFDQLSQKAEELTNGNGLDKAKQRIKKRLRKLEEAVDNEMN